MSTWIRLLLVVAMLPAVGCGKKDEPPPAPVEKAAEPSAADATTAAEPTPAEAQSAILPAVLHGMYVSNKEVECQNGGAVVTLTANSMFAESADSTCTKMASWATVKEDGPFTIVTLSDETSLRFKLKDVGLSIGGDGAGYLAGTYARDAKVSADGWAHGEAKELPEALRKEFKSCPDVECEDGGATLTLTASSFYAESKDSTCTLSGEAKELATSGPFTTMKIGDSETLHVRAYDGGLRVGGLGASYLAGHFQGEGGKCPPKPEPAGEEAGGEATEEAEMAAEEEASNACLAYAECCSAAVMALYDLDGQDALAEGAEKTCEAITEMEDLPGAADACKQGLVAMKQGMAAWKALPGFETPDSCK